MKAQAVGFHDTDLGTRLQFIEDLYKLASVNIIVVAYRGYSMSDGTPSEAGIKIDGIAIADYAFNQKVLLDLSRVYLLGKSLGGAVAAWTAANTKHKVKGSHKVIRCYH